MVQSWDMEETALAVVLQGDLNRVVWDECHLIWDSRDLIEESPAGENLASRLALLHLVTAQPVVTGLRELELSKKLMCDEPRWQSSG
jgi:hypothetical protein